MGLLLLFLFIAIPILEVVLFIEIGGLIGVWPTIGIIVLTAIVGSALVRAQGLAVVAEAQRKADAGEPPVGALAHGLMIVVAGVLMVTPGFFTDAVGFALLIPPVRAWLARAAWAYLRRRGTVHVRTARGPGQGGQERGRTIEGDYRNVTPEAEPAKPDEPDEPDEPEDERREPDADSPWRRR